MMNISTVHAEWSDPPQLLVLILILNKINQLVASQTIESAFYSCHIILDFGFVSLLHFRFFAFGKCMHPYQPYGNCTRDHCSMNLSL